MVDAPLHALAKPLPFRPHQDGERPPQDPLRHLEERGRRLDLRAHHPQARGLQLIERPTRSKTM